MTELEKFLEQYINETLLRIVISGPREKNQVSKIQIRPLLLKGQLRYQITRTLGQKELHENCTKEEIKEIISHELKENFRQLQMEASGCRGMVLVSKKGKMTIKTGRKQQEEPAPVLMHNRKKKYLIPDGIPVPFLVELGVMDKDGQVNKSRYDKFRQLNRFLEFIEDILPVLPKNREITILDFGCGKSYLTFAMYHYLHEIKKYDIRVTGLDLKEDVIALCSRLAEKYGYDKLNFCQGDIASYEGSNQIDMVVTLHACDTATDYALEKAVKWGASVILSVPCCQHELNRQLSNELLQPILKYGILKERFAAILTDGLRASMLESAGYDTQILEFIDMEHTPKNLLIRAVKRSPSAEREEKKSGWEACAREMHVNPMLEKLLF